MVSFVSEELHALHLAPSLVIGGSVGDPLGKSGFTSRSPFALAPFEVLLVRLEQGVRFGGGEFTNLGKVVLDHGQS